MKLKRVIDRLYEIHHTDESPCCRDEPLGQPHPVSWFRAELEERGTKVTRATVHNWCNRGIPPHREDQVYAILEDIMDEWLLRCPLCGDAHIDWEDRAEHLVEVHGWRKRAKTA